EPGGPRLSQPVLDERRQELEPGRDRALPQRLQQMVLELDVVLYRWQRGHRLQIEGVVLSEARIQADALLVVVRERAAERVADEPPRDPIAQRDADRARVRHRRFERRARVLDRPPA